MPYRSARQERWAHTPAGEEALGGPKKVSEWDAASKGMDLPETAPGSKLRKAGGNRGLEPKKR